MTPEPLTSASAADLAALSDLCLRSKGYWGYDAAFLDACREELRLTPEDLTDPLAVTRNGNRFSGIVQLDVGPREAEIDKLFVDPQDIGSGLGKSLFGWAVQQARAAAVFRLRIVADPGAQPFYEAMGAVLTGSAPSASIPGRDLPVLYLEL